MGFEGYGWAGLIVLEVERFEPPAQTNSSAVRARGMPVNFLCHGGVRTPDPVPRHGTVAVSPFHIISRDSGQVNRYSRPGPRDPRWALA